MTKLLFALIALTVVLAPAAGAEPIREISEQFKIPEGQILRIAIPVAELDIEAIDGGRLEADLTIRCRWSLDRCEDTLERLSLETRSTSRRLILELAGASRWPGSKLDIDGTLRVPRAVDLEIEMGVAELDISGIERDLRVDLGVGEVRAWLPAAKFGRISLDVGVGQAQLEGTDSLVRARRSLLVGSEVHWHEGSGPARADIEVGVGEIIVWLEPPAEATTR